MTRFAGAVTARGRRLVGLAAILVFWQIGASQGWLGVSTPPPTRVWTAGVELISTGELQHHLAASLSRVGRGGLAIGSVRRPGARCLGRAGPARRGPRRRSRPGAADAAGPGAGPMFIIWFGIGETAKVDADRRRRVFPLYLNTYAGIRGIDARLVEAARRCGLRRLGLIRHVIMPGALPQILVGVRQSLGVAWLSAGRRRADRRPAPASGS